MSTYDWFLAIGQFASGLVMIFGIGALWTWLNQHQAVEFDREDKAHANHERWAKEREARAVERNEHVVASLAQMEQIVRGVNAHRNDLDNRVEMLEAAIDNHAEHLEVLGRPGVARIPTK